MRDDEFVLSAAQVSIWLAQMAQPTVPYTIAQYVEITGDVDIDTLLSALLVIGHQTEVTGTRIHQRGNELGQSIDHDGPWRAGYIDFRSHADPEDSARRHMRQQASRLVDMSSDQLLTQELLHVADQRFFLLGVAHHVVVDGVGAIAMLDAVAETYTALAAGEAAPIRSRMSVRELVDYQREYPETSRWESDRAHWLERLRDLPAPARLSDRSHPPSATTATVSATVNGVVAPVNQGRDGFTDVSIVLATFAVYIARMTGRKGVVLSLPVSGRVTAKLRNSAGMLANVVPLRVDVPDAGTVGELLRQITVELTGALRHQRYRFEDMLRDLEELSGRSGQPLGAGGRGAFGPTVNIMMFGNRLQFGDAVGEYQVLSSGPVDDLMVNVYPSVRGGSTRVDFLANPAAYDADDLAAHHRAFLDLLTVIGAADPATALGSLVTVDQPTAPSAPAGVLLPALLPRTDAPALLDANGPVSYRNLDVASNAFARAMLAEGIGPGERVAVLLPRGCDYVLAFWAIAKTGAAVVPLDPTDPAERTAARLAGLGVRHAIGDVPDHGSPADGTPADAALPVRWLSVPHTAVDPASALAAPITDAARPAGLTALHEAYVLHTSGSTGTPKAVAVTHTGLAALIAGLQQRWATGEPPRVLHLAAPTFDVSVLDILATASLGGTLVIPEREVVAGAAVGEWLRRETITHLSTVPAVLGTLDPADLESVRVVQVGGDRLDPSLARRITDGDRGLFNAYGLTETTVEVLSTAPDDATEGRTDLGVPLPGVRADVFDARLRPVPRGGVGELYVEGPSLARGYVGAPGITAARFIAAPGGGRRYRTGDLVRRRITDGRPNILGRSDDQVQIHGRRFEPGEVDAALRASAGIRDAVTVVRGQRLVGYVAADEDLDLADVATDLRRRLPAWMVPAHLVRLDALPLTTAGKIDRAALPEPTVRSDVGAPEGPTETAVAEAIRAVLPAGPADAVTIGREHSFFELGGDSLGATRLIERLHNGFGAAPTLAEIFADPTVAGIGASLTAARTRIDTEARDITDALGPAELRLWVLNQLDTSSTVFTMPMAVRSAPGAPPIEAILAAVAAVIARHEALRTYFPFDHGEPVRRIVAAERIPIPEPTTVDAARFEAIIAATGRTTFDLTAAPPVHIGAYTSGDQWLLTVAVHHINLDGWSADILTADLVAELLAGADPGDVPPGPARYVAGRQRRADAIGPGVLDERRHTFATHIGTDPVADLPADRPTSAGTVGGAAANIAFTIDAERYTRLRELAASLHATPFAVLHGAITLVLAAMSGRAATVVVSPVSGRDRPEFARTVGLLVETIALPVRVDPGRTVAEHLTAVRDADRASIAAADLPYERLVEAVPAAASRILFTLDTSDHRLPDLPVTLVDIDTEATEFDLVIDLRESDGAATGQIRYAIARYDRDTVDGFGRALGAALDVMVADPTARVGAIALDGPRTAPQDRPATETPAVPNRGLSILDADAALLGSDQIADRVHRLATRLRARGAGPDVPVAIHLRRGADYVVAVLAIWAVGAAFVPIDPDAPAARRIAMARIARIGVAGEAEPGIPGTSWICRDEGRMPAPDPLPALTVHPDTLAYVIHTSGTTGQPKPVAVPHRAVAALAADVVDRYGVTADSTVAQGYSTAFDAAILELLLAVSTGARLAIVPNGLFGGYEMAQWLRDARVTHFLSTPAALATVPPVESVQVAAVGGDVCPPGLVDRWGTDRPLLNAYGPTEAAVVATLAGPLRPGADVTIGASLPSVSADVLNDRLGTTPIGGIGELYVGGPHLARGYLGSPAETAARFVAAPGGRRRYRTGDLVRTRRDGQFDFRGRRDSQIQIAGRRMELDEPAAVLRTHPGVDDAVVARDGDRLHAWVVGEAPDATWLADHLPPWMIPHRLHRVAALPLTTNGKVDRQVLLEGIPVDDPTPPTAGPAPTAGEELVCASYAEVFGVERVAPDADFFDLGGDSLRAARIAGRLGAATGLRIPIRDVLDAPTPRALAHRIARITADATGSRPPVRPYPGDVARMPSPGEMRMWAAQRLEPNSAARNLAVAIDLPATLSADVIGAALRDVLDRHVTLRTRYPNDDGPVTVVIDPTPTGIDEMVVDDPDAAERRLAMQPFDLSAAAPVRMVLLRSETGSRRLVVVAHHIAVDGASLTTLGADFHTALAARSTAAAPQFPAPPITYPDYRAWMAELIGTPDRPTPIAREQLDYWTEVLHERPERLALPIGEIDPTANEPVVFGIPADVGATVTALARHANATVFTVLHAALAVTLAGLAGTDDVMIGTPVAGRTEPEFDGVVGMFAGTVPLRTRLPRAGTFAEVLAAVRDDDLDAFANQDVPLEWVTVSAGESADVPFTVMFVVHPPNPQSALQSGVRPITVPTAQFDIDWVLTENADGGLGGEVRFAAGRYGRDAIIAMVETFGRVLATVLAAPQVSLAAIPTCAASPVPDPVAITEPPITLGGIFRAAGESGPDNVALLDSTRGWTYRLLDAEAADTVDALRAAGARPGTVVAIVLPRSASLVTAIWAVAQTGAAFLPIDPRIPTTRVTEMLAATTPIAIIDPNGVRAGDDPIAATRHAHDQPVRPDDPAYLIYTSGSTGVPKAVRVPHRGLAQLVHSQRTLFGVDVRSRILLGASPSFDASVFEILLAFGSGAALVVPPLEVTAGDELTAVLTAAGVTHICLTPSVLAATDPTPAGTVTTVISAGEAANAELLGRWATAGRPRRVFNAYGPTEATIMATCGAPVGATGPSSPTAAPSIGRPIEGVRAAVLDGWLRPVGVGTIGELYLAGSTLAEGYHGNPALTATRFVADPLGPPGSRRYRTGDLVRPRWPIVGGGEPRTDPGFPHGSVYAESPRAQVELEFLGRADSQIKVRGHRVEPAEIEAALVTDGDIAAAAVIGIPQSDGSTALAAYVTARPGAAAPAPRDLRARLARRLPRYLVPATIQIIDRVPLTVSGKLDVRALPTPVSRAVAHRPASTPTEVAVTEIFAEVLDPTEPVGVDDDFFDIGGHSLAAVRVADLLRGRLAAGIPVAWVLTHPTPAALAERIDVALAERRSAPDAGDDPAGDTHRAESVDSALAASLDVVLPIRAGTGPGLFCIHPAVGLAWSYTGLADGIDPRVPIHGLQAPQVSGAPSPTDIDDYARIYVDRMREIQPEGPYRLLGWSLGGLIAHAAARRLIGMGERVDLLVLLDTWLDVIPDAARFTPADLARHLGIGVAEPSDNTGYDQPGFAPPAGPGESDATEPGFADIADRLRREHPALGGLTADHLARAFDPMEAAGDLASRYRATLVEVPTVLVLAQDSTADRSWGGALPADTRLHRIAVPHNDLLGPHSRSEVAGIIDRYLAVAQTDSPATSEVIHTAAASADRNPSAFHR